MGFSSSAIAVDTEVLSGASTDEDNTLYVRAAIKNARSKIEVVPGSGNIRGVWMFNNTKYAFRDNESGTLCVMWASSSDGWQEVDLGAYTDFSNGTDTLDIGFEKFMKKASGHNFSASFIISKICGIIRNA